jgi:transcriptional regulator with AAA-type ATPase domain
MYPEIQQNNDRVQYRNLTQGVSYNLGPHGDIGLSVNVDFYVTWDGHTLEIKSGEDIRHLTSRDTSTDWQGVTFCLRKGHIQSQIRTKGADEHETRIQWKRDVEKLEEDLEKSDLSQIWEKAYKYFKTATDFLEKWGVVLVNEEGVYQTILPDFRYSRRILKKIQDQTGTQIYRVPSEEQTNSLDQVKGVVCTPVRDKADRMVAALFGISSKYVELPKFLEDWCNDIASRIARILEERLYPTEGFTNILWHLDRDFFQFFARAAGSRAPVLLLGESGVGKEYHSRLIHEFFCKVQKKKDLPFVALNCGAFTEYLLPDELFGHVRGAFNEAYSSRDGAFVTADGGTLFLDEVGEMSEHAQKMFLRVLETGKVQPLGSDKPRHVDVRIVAGTNRDLKHEVEKGNFRADLFYRLSTLPYTIPPLRETPGFIGTLANFFVRQHGCKEWSEDSLKRFQTYGWPGNIRQLANFVERFSLYHKPCSTAAVSQDFWDKYQQDQPGFHGTEDSGTEDSAPRNLQTLEAMEKTPIERVLQSTDGNISQAARILGIHRGTLAKKMKKYGIEGGKS